MGYEKIIWMSISIVADAFLIVRVLIYSHRYHVWTHTYATGERNVATITETEYILAALSYDEIIYEKELPHSYSSTHFSPGDKISVMFDPKRPSSFVMIDLNISVISPMIGITFFTAQIFYNI